MFVCMIVMERDLHEEDMGRARLSRGASQYVSTHALAAAGPSYAMAKAVMGMKRAVLI